MKHNQFLVKPGKRIKLVDFDSAYTGSFAGREEVAEKLEKNVSRLRKYQDVLYAENTHALLIVFQGSFSRRPRSRLLVLPKYIEG